MSTFGWVLIALAFLVLVAVVNNSWVPIWDGFKAWQQGTNSQPGLPSSGTDAAQTTNTQQNNPSNIPAGGGGSGGFSNGTQSNPSNIPAGGGGTGGFR